jgi:FK506-binding nuclear protein
LQWQAKKEEAPAKKEEVKVEVKAETPKKKAEKGSTTPGKERVKTYPNGLEVHTVSLGKANGQEATPGKRVMMRYEGRLKSNNKVFDSTKGKGPFDFRLGVGEVIKGWDVGVKGMRIGDKRQLVIPPGMAYGREGVRGTIPPNAWLVFDIELVNVK